MDLFKKAKYLKLSNKKPTAHGWYWCVVDNYKTIVYVYYKSENDKKLCFKRCEAVHEVNKTNCLWGLEPIPEATK